MRRIEVSADPRLIRKVLQAFGRDENVRRNDLTFSHEVVKESGATIRATKTILVMP
jgi:hypothetical protein